MAQRREAVRELAALAAEAAEADRALQRVWDRLSSEGAADLLLALVESASGLDPRAWGGRLVRALDPSHAGYERLRAPIVQAIKGLGEEAAEALASRLLAPGDEGAQWALYALREIGLGAAADVLAKAFARADPPARARLAERLARVAGESWEGMMCLLATLASARRGSGGLLDALLDRLGRDALEQQCARLWARDRMEDARVVLEHCFRYDAKALG